MKTAKAETNSVPARQSYYPETVVFVIDVREDLGIEYGKYVSRLELLKQCIGYCAQAKSRMNPGHKFGLAVIRDSVQWEGGCITASAEGLLTALRAVHPLPAGGHGTAPPRPLDLSALVSLVQPLAVAEEADGCRVRVVLVYCRSAELPRWTNRHWSGEGLCMDALFVYDKAAAAAAAAASPEPHCSSPQDVYTWLEDNLDELSSRCAHHAYIFEAGGHLVRKVMNLLINLMAHPAQRPPQRALRATFLDLAAIPSLSASGNIGAPTATAPSVTTATASPDASAFPPLPTAATAAPAANLPATGAWGVIVTPPHGSCHPSAEMDLINLSSPSEHPLPPPSLSPPPAAGAATPLPS
ncbi:hypothetical protein VaNZ11_000072 [Volvox africanus]|uniref:BRISC and BRCA1-A complex member 1 n=1 Tax=Volvox africanus TaxID=51714 RepID=A0ABQ5RMC2_9CHLO|nr:hypothetical protein VaNZ11_000072 [Volvox africanus]